MGSSEKISSLERPLKPNHLFSAVGDLNQAVYGGTNNSNLYAPPSASYNAPTYDSPKSPIYKSPNVSSASHYASLSAPKSYGATNTSPKPFGSEAFKPLSFDAKSGSDGYTSSEYATNTYKTPDGYHTDTYKYEYYKSEPKTTYASNTEKYYSSDGKGFTPLSPKSAFGAFKNGDEQYQSSYSSNVEYITEPPVLKNDSLEQKTIKKSINEQIFEKKTTTTSRTTKQESQMKTFKFQ